MNRKQAVRLAVIIMIVAGVALWAYNISSISRIMTIKHIKKVNEDNILYEYTGKDYYGVEIPDGVRILIASELYAEGDGLINYMLSKKNLSAQRVFGLYNRKNRIIKLVLGNDIIDNRKRLKHELAHDEYVYNLTDRQLYRLGVLHDLYCENSNEFYAYSIQHYGEFQWT